MQLLANNEIELNLWKRWKHFPQGRGAPAETTKAEDVARLRIPAMKAKETVTVQVTEVNMMVMQDAKETCFVGAITANNLGLTSTQRTTAVKKHQSQNLERNPHQLSIY